MKRRSRFFAAALLSALAALTLAGAAAADPPQLTGQRTSSNFYPCTDPQDATPPTLADCPSPVLQVTATCDPDGVSTLSLTRTGNAFGAPPLFNGTYTETINWTLGPQTNPAVPAFFPFPGPPAESVGLLTGEVLSLDATFTIAQGGTTVTGTKTLVANPGNWGVCRQFTDEDLEGPVFGGTAPHTGNIYILGAGVLSYEATVDNGVTQTTESGLAESYAMNSYATCCNSASPSTVSSATGHLQEGFGTTHPASGTSGSAPTTGPGTVEPLPEVEITFGTVNAPGTTTAVLTTSVPPLPAGFQVGVPPAFYEISTTADVAFPVTVCIGFGALPAGTTEPTLFHYEGDQWVDVTTSFTFNPDKVCGSVTSLSPFAVAFEEGYTISGPFAPVDQQPTFNVMSAGRTVPVKFSLGGDFGLDIFASGYPASQSIECDSNDPIDAVETTSSTGSGLTYDATSGTYQYNWKTSKGWAGQCRTLILKFDSGQELRADFKFK